MQRSLLITAVTSFMLSNQALAAPMTDAEADLISGHLCALSQRIAKDYLAIGAGIRPEAMQKDLQESMATFDKELAQLKQYASEHDLQQPVAALDGDWQQFSNQITSEPQLQQANAVAVMNQSDELLKKCNNTVAAVSHQSDSSNANLIDLSEREATLTQVIARDYIAFYWHVDSEEVEQNLTSAISQFDATIAMLEANGATSSRTKDLVRQIQSQWNFSRRGLNLQNSDELVPVVINSTTNSIYTKMTALAEAYMQES